jgi:hypothetical protein
MESKIAEKLKFLRELDAGNKAGKP